MKYAKQFCIFLIVFLTVITFERTIAQQNTGDNDPKKQAFKNMVDSQHFVFVAQSATPLRGGFRNLTSLYDVSILGDTMICYLPYFGRAYTAPVNPSEGGLNFTSTNFLYTATPHKKDGWEVKIKPKDNTDIQQFLFTIYDNGSASLGVTSNSRDPISFNGYIQKEKKKKKRT